ncbi:MAG: alkaline phosphatase family protein [Prevotella sp.]|nr:alkaline phosphatase family protein [Prevotella sp.]
MKKQLLTLMMLLVSVAAFSQDRPKLVVGIVVDQMRWDYLYRFYDEYGEGGFKRLMNEGFNCENCQINYIPSVTAIGHTSVFTGSVPSIHGIAGNNYYLNGKWTYCCADSTVQTVGSNTKAGLMSPRNMLATTIGDELKTATNWESKVIGVSFKDRAAILPAGHSADAAYWFDKKAFCFISSTYYMQELPKWVKSYNERIGREIKQLERKNKDAELIDLIQFEPYGNEITVGMAKAAVKNERLGLGKKTDMLTLSFSCPDITGHSFGTHHEKTHAQYVELDKQLADFFNFLDTQVGKGNYLVFLAADHGAANSVVQNQRHNIPAGSFHEGQEVKNLNAMLEEMSGMTDLVSRIMDYKVVLNHEKIANAHLDISKIKTAVINYFKPKKEVAYCFDLEKINDASVPAIIREKAVNGYNQQRGGDIQIILKPAYYAVWDGIGEGTTHGCWNPYDCHIPFLLMGWGVEHGSTQAECHITDIAATVCALIHVQMPNGCIGKAVTQVTK